MARLVFRNIKEKNEIEYFLLRFEDYVGVKLPESYVAKGNINGVYLKNRMVGGYITISSPPFRSLLFVPDKVKTKNSRLLKNQYEMMEVNGLWLSASLRDPKLQMEIWFHLVSSIFLTRKKYVLLLRNSHNKAMERLMNLANPRLLYEGVPILMAGEITHDRVEVSFTTRWSILLYSYKYWKELRSRQSRARTFGSRIKKVSRLDVIEQP